MDRLSGPATALRSRARALIVRLQTLVATGQADGDETLAQRLSELAAGLDALFLLVVVGEFNAGKSTVVNALFGETIMEEGPVPTTDKITVLRYGESLETHRRGEFVTERRYPSPLLKDLDLVDTPGTNSIVREHQTLTEDFIPRADLILFVTSFDRPLSDSERQFLQYIRGDWGKRLVVILNKADLAQNEAALSQVMGHIRDGFQEHLGFTPHVFPVSARPALAAKQAHPDQPSLDPGWEASGFEAFERFLTTTLTTDERLALKLGAPLDALDRVLATLTARFEEQKTVLERDEAGLDTLRQRFEEKELQLRDAFTHALTEVDNELLEMEKRGVRFLDDTIRVAKLGLIRDRDAFKEEFARQVIRDAERRIETRTGEAVDVLLRHVYELWNETYAHLAEQRRLAGEKGPDSFLYNRDEVFRDVMREAKRSIDQYDLNEEARRILENARATAALFAGTQAAALGLGAIAGVVIAASAFDVTGGLVAAGVLAAFGFVLLPRQKRRAIREFTARVDALRADLARALRDQFEEEVEDAMQRVRRLIHPLEALTQSQRETLEASTEEGIALHRDAAALRRDVVEQFGAGGRVEDA